MGKRYHLELTESQLRLIADCVEDIHRFASGQVELSNTTSVIGQRGGELRAKLKECYPYVVPELYKEHRGAYGTSYSWSGATCPNEAQRKLIAQTYYIYREILHRLVMDNKTDDGSWNVYESETLRCEDSGEPIKIKRI